MYISLSFLFFICLFDTPIFFLSLPSSGITHGDGIRMMKMKLHHDLISNYGPTTIRPVITNSSSVRVKMRMLVDHIADFVSHYNICLRARLKLLIVINVELNFIRMFKNIFDFHFTVHYFW